jgi:ceramide glucosyltransferase
MNLLAAFSAGFTTISLLYYVTASFAALRFSRRVASPPPPLPKVLPRVAILKPLHGLSASLAGNVLSYMELDYPRTEYIFGVSDYEDRATDVPVAFKARYSFAQTTLVVGEEPGCANRKVAKLIKMAERAQRAQVFLISDADIAVDRGHVRRVVGELTADETTGMVTCLYRARPRGAFASRLEALFVNTDFVPMVMLSAAIEPIRYGLGATIAIKREVLEKVGGFQQLRNHLADDYYLGKMTADQGYRIKLSTSVVTMTTEEKHLREFWHHQLRWARTYRTARPLSVATIVLHGPFWAIVLVLAAGVTKLTIAIFALVIIMRILMASFFIRRVLGLRDLCSEAWLVPLKDLIMTAVWFVSLFGNKVLWGGRRLWIRTDGTMHEVHG